MGQKRYRTINAFISNKKLRGWKTPKPETELSWKEIKTLHQKAVNLARERSNQHEYDRVEKELRIACLYWTKNGEKPLAVRIQDWLDDISKELILHIKPFALRQELWYEALAWEFLEWRWDMARQYFDGERKALQEESNSLSDQIDKATENLWDAEDKAQADRVEVIGEEIDEMMKRQQRTDEREFGLDKREEAWFENYPKQRILLNQWLRWRGLRLSPKDIDTRLLRYIPIW